MQYKITDNASYRLVKIGKEKYKTNYSKQVIEMLIKRKGLLRAVEYFDHKEKRSRDLLPLFQHLNMKTSNLTVLEVGCSAGHITEFLCEQPSVKQIYTYDVDKALVDVMKFKKVEMKLDKVRQIDLFTIEETEKLPYKNDFFDLIIVQAIVEHLPFENRYIYIDNYYKKLKIGGLIIFSDTPNRYFPIELHSVKLPFIHWMPPQLAFIYAKLIRRIKYRNLSFAEFTRAGTGWRNSSYYELLPKRLIIDVKDVTYEVGYSCKWYLFRLLAKVFNVPYSFFTPRLNVVFKKIKNYEK